MNCVAPQVLIPSAGRRNSLGSKLFFAVLEASKVCVFVCVLHWFCNPFVFGHLIELSAACRTAERGCSPLGPPGLHRHRRSPPQQFLCFVCGP